MNTTVSPTTTQTVPVKSRGRVRSWLKRVLLGLIAAVAGISGIGAIYQAIAVRADQRTYLPPGQFVDVNGRRIHMLVLGHETNRPTVLLEAGIATFSSNWAWVQEELAASTRVVTYDRAGLGWSDPAPEPQDAQQSAMDLHAALEAADIQGPYVVAGHSYGGLVVRAFTDLYPDEVVGMVLVDASHPDQWAAVPAAKGGRMVAVGNRVTGFLARLGIVRMLDMYQSIRAGLPEQQAAEMKAILAQPQSWSTSGDTLALWDARSRPQINQARELGDLPLVVLTAPVRPSGASVGGYADALNSQQAELSTLSSNSLHLTVQGATHESLVAEREHALVVANGVLKAIEAAETGKPLTAE
jgi:pimeloyl-ACP methyl ester carboxylesterase